LGIDANLAFYLLSISNASSGMGRLLCAYAAQRIGMCHSSANNEHLSENILGTLNAMIPITAVAGALTIAWPFVTTKGGLIVLALTYG
jgi:MFS transporter, MCT family, solute carrier family 16 (monocarboxylic acid transporters), member 10